MHKEEQEQQNKQREQNKAQIKGNEEQKSLTEIEVTKEDLKNTPQKKTITSSDSAVIKVQQVFLK